MIYVKLKDSSNGNIAKVDEEGAIHVIAHPHPPLEEQVHSKPFRQRFTDVNGVANMNVNGSVTNVSFSINASEDYDIFVKSIFVEIADGGSPALNKFGALASLTNGVQWIYFNQNEGSYLLHEGIKTNKEFIRLGNETHGIGTGTDAYLADTSGGGTEKAYLPIIDVGELFGMQYGLRLRKGTTDRLTWKVRDDLTGLVTFDAIATGQRI